MRPKSQPIILAARISPPVLSIQSSRNIRQNSPIKHMWQCKHIPAHNRINKLHKQALLLTSPMAIAETKTPLNAETSVGKAMSPTQPIPNCSRKDESQTTIIKKYGQPQKTPSTWRDKHWHPTWHQLLCPQHLTPPLMKAAQD